MNATKHNDQNSISGKYMLSSCRMNMGKLKPRGKKRDCWGEAKDKVKVYKKGKAKDWELGRKLFGQNLETH